MDNSLISEEKYLYVIKDTSKLVASQKAKELGNTVAAFKESKVLANDVEFWKWMGANYKNDLGSTSSIQQAAMEKSRWLNTQLQGKGYEWDYMNAQRMKPQNVLNQYYAGDCPTQPGIDITESNIITKETIGTYQNKAYLSSNNPDLHNTPKDAVVVTNKEKVVYSEEQGYVTESFMDADEIRDIRDQRFKRASEGKAQNTYNIKNVASASLKAGIIGAVIGMTVETISSYDSWKHGEITEQQYVEEILKAGGEAGITASATTAIMVPVQSMIIAGGMSSLIGIPVAIIVSSAIDKVVAPCFGRGEYRKILNEVKYYQNLNTFYDEFLNTIERSSDSFYEYAVGLRNLSNEYDDMKRTSKQIDLELGKLYDSI